MYPCPACGRSFDTRRGLGVHHVSAHGERLPNRTCNYCEYTFYSDTDIKYCSDECLSLAAPYAGTSNPNYRGAKEETTCELCDQPFSFYPSEKQDIYCSTCVQSAEWQEPPSKSGRDNLHWNGGKNTQPCAICGETVERWPSEFAENAVLCSESCRHEWLSEAFTGAGHPNWEGGDPGPYGTGWASVRRQALERDGYECRQCGATTEDLSRNPNVHHIVPVRHSLEADGRSVEDAHTLENVITLCITCHRKADFGHISQQALRELLRD